VTIAVLTVGSLVSFAHLASAQPGLQGSYVGVAVDGNRMPENLPALLSDGNPQNWILNSTIRQLGANQTSPSNGEAAAIGRQFQGRLDLPNQPMSVRGSVYTGAGSTAILPTLTYDLPIGHGTNVYAGAGYAIVNGGSETPLGNQNGVVLTTGFEAAAGRNLVIFGDTKLNLNDDSTRSSGAPIRVQFGAGIRF
jgi:hypothetical protein